MQAEMMYIYEVYRTGSFSQAARNLFLTQPALSIAVKKVEAAIGMPLFDRSQQPLALTEAGNVYLRRIQEIRYIEDNLAKELADLKKQDTGHLTIGGTQYFNSYVLPEVLSECRQLYPGISLTLREDNSRIIDDWLAKGETDISFHSIPIDENLFQSEPLFTDELLLAVPKTLMPSAAWENSLSCQQVAEGFFQQPECPVQKLNAFHSTPFLILTESNQLRERALSICRENSLEPEVLLYVEQLETAWHFARHGLGATFVTNLIIAETMDDNLRYFRLKSSHALRPFHAIMRKNAFVSRCMKIFIELIQKHQNKIS